jgi:hypothetical protein
MHSQWLTRDAAILRCIAAPSELTVATTTWAQQWQCLWKDGEKEQQKDAVQTARPQRCSLVSQDCMKTMWGCTEDSTHLRFW